MDFQLWLPGHRNNDRSSGFLLRSAKIEMVTSLGLGH